MSDPKLRRKLKGRFAEKEDKPKYMPGLLGNGQGVVTTGTAGIVYVRVNEMATTAVCTTLPPVNDLPVWVYKPAFDQARLHVHSQRFFGGADEQIISGTSQHAETHRYFGSGSKGGTDVLYSDPRQILGLRIYPIENTMTCEVFPWLIWIDGVPKLIGTLEEDGTYTAEVLDFSPYLITTEDKSKIMLVTLDTSGELVITEGEEVDTDALSIETDTPARPAGTKVVLGAVRLYYGQYAIQEGRENTDLIDGRWMFDHTHSWTELDLDEDDLMFKSVYDIDEDDIVDEAAAIDGIDAAGNSKYYGTDEAGDPGFYDLIEGGVSVPMQEAIGTLTLSGDPVTVLDDSDHNAFPGACVLADGTIIIVYRDATSHSSSKGIAKMRTSDDGGATWSAEATVYEHATLDSRDPCITRLMNGNLIVSIKLYNWGVDDHTSQIVISTDDGTTWGSPIQVSDGFTDYGGCSAPVVELANGDLILPTFGKDTGDTYESSRLSISRDGGATWAYYATIVEDTRNYQEPNIVMLDNGVLVCLIRSTTTNHHYRSYSYDGGKTWSAVVDVFAAEGRPCLAKVSNGALINIYRKPSPEISVYRISLDGGWSWGDETTLDNNATHAYATTVEYEYGSIGVIFARQASTSNSDLIWQRMTASHPYSLTGHEHTESDITDLDHDAVKIDGIYVDLAGIADGNALIYDEYTDTIVAGEGGGGAAAFVDLTDAPADYTDDGGKYVRVKATEDGLEFATPAGAGDMLKATYDADEDDVVDEAAAVEGVDAAGNSKYYGTDGSGTPGFYDLPSGAEDTAAIHDDESGEIHAITEKETPVDDDELLIEDSEASYAKKRLKISNLPAAGGGDAIYPQSAILFVHQFVITAGGGALNLAVNTAQLYNILGNMDTNANGDAMQCSVLLKAGTYNVSVLGSTANNKPIVDWSMDGVNFITGQDWYSSGTTYKVIKTGEVTIAADGRHLVKVTINGKNGSSSAYVFTMTSIHFNAQSLTTET